MIANLKQLFFLFLVIVLVSCAPDRPETARGQVEEPMKKTRDSKIETVHFFLENSLSMFGYFNSSQLSGPRLYMDVGDLLNRMSRTSDTVKTYLISEKVHPTEKSPADFMSYYSYSDRLEIEDQGLTSDITEMFAECIQRASGNNVSVLISDAIYSIKAEDIEKELDLAAQKTKNELIDLLSTRNFAIVAAKFHGVFNGVYYYPDDTPEEIDQLRPYYIWFFGELDQVKALLEKIRIEKEDGFQNSAFFFKVEDVTCESQVLNRGSFKKGTYKSKKADNVHVIENAENATRGTSKGEFQFGLAVDFSDLPLTSDYLENVENYLLEPDGYEVVQIIPSSDFDKDASNAINLFVKDWEPTHIIVLKNKSKLLGSYNVSLVSKLPAWIDESSSLNDLTVVGNVSTTFGLKNLIDDGIFKAFAEMNDQNPYWNTKFNVQP